MSANDDNTVRVFGADELTMREAGPGSRYWSVRLPGVMLTYFTVAPRAQFATHAHASEQITYVARGTLVFAVEGHELSVRSGEAIRLPANVPHSAVALDEPVEAFDAWSPPAHQPWACQGSGRNAGNLPRRVETPEPPPPLPVRGDQFGFGIKGLA